VLDPTELTTARLLLSPLRVADAPAMVSLLSDARMYEFTGGSPPTLAELTDRYERLAGRRSSDGSELWFNWIVRLRDGAVPVGVVQATVAPDGTTADVAWEIGVEWQGRGLAGEAAVELVRWLITEDVAQISALVHPDHVASQRVAERAGLVRTNEVDDGEVVWRLPTRLRSEPPG
jgi:RimJ/RimL family protein N-acetyltransferase